MTAAAQALYAHNEAAGAEASAWLMSVLRKISEKPGHHGKLLVEIDVANSAATFLETKDATRRKLPSLKT